MQTRKFFIKVLVRNQSCLNVRTSISEDKGYSLKRDGWITSFTDLNNQSMRDDGVPWRGAREKRPDFFNTLFSALTDKDDIIFDWQCGVGLSLMSPFFFFPFICICYFSLSFCFPYLIAFSSPRRIDRCLPLLATPYCCVGIRH